MFTIVIYDADQRRDKKLLNICQRYLNHIQKSVFEGNITDSKLNQLKKELKAAMNVKEDSCIIYCIGNTKYCHKERIGTCIETADEEL